MRQQVLLDTGPLIALIDRRDHHHSWVTTELATIQPPLLSCEAVLSEAWFLLQRVNNGRETLVGLLKSQQILVAFQFNEEVESITELLTRYRSVPISFADASLVRMAELYPSSEVLTLDSDFLIYRKHKNQPIPVIMPEV
ncbi:MAG: PIN domain-containing protein [Scytonema sp. PMC 1069.18]|nr:PIN domain-containing protein [Scytonema sp. PMC 1069.18]MEC4887126.1 PIN domain-containing protein [Scytonema sp. PMC 1070.18]